MPGLKARALPRLGRLQRGPSCSLWVRRVIQSIVFFPLSTKRLNAVKQGDKKGPSAGSARRPGGPEGDRDEAWILITRLIKDLLQP